MVTLESSLAAVKIALTQFGAATSVNPASAVLSSTQSTTAGAVVPGASSTLSLSQVSTRSLDMQRQLDSAYQAQAMLEVAGKANAAMTVRLKDLRKIAVQASSDSLAQSERAFLSSQFEGVRQSLLTQTQHTRWDGMRLFDGTAGSKRDGTLSFTVGAGAAGKLDISLPNLRADAMRTSGVRAIQGSLGPGTREQQTIGVDGVSLAYTSGALSVGDLTLNSGDLGAQASLSDLIAGFTSDANYADAAFTIADNGSGALAVTWKNTGAVSSTAQLQLTPLSASQTVAATRSVTGGSAADSPATSEEQFISLSDSDLSSAASVMLNDGSSSPNNYGVAFSAGSTTIQGLAEALNTSYSGSMPFTVTAESGGLRLNWSATGAQSGLASLSVSSADAAQTSFSTQTFDAAQVTAGASAGAREVQNITLSAADIQGKTLSLSADGITLSSGAMASDASLSDLVSAFQSDSNYSAAGFEISVNTQNGSDTGLKLSWNSEAAVSDTATLSLLATGNAATIDAVQTTVGSNTSVIDGTSEVQRIAVRTSAIAGRNVQLRAGDVSLLSGPLDANATVSQLASALKANPRYSAAPFEISQDKPGYLTLTWKTPGTVSQLAALEVQPDNPLLSLMKRGGVSSSQAAQSMTAAIDRSLQTLSTLDNDLGVSGVKLAAAVQTLSSAKAGTVTVTGAGQQTAQAGQAYVSAITSMLRTQIADNASQAAAAQANYTPQSVINTLSLSR